MDLLEWVGRRDMNMVRGLEHLPCEDWLREFRLFSLEKTLGRLHCGLSIPKGGL